MPRGPLPKPDARRRNAPTIPTTKLPAGGRTERAPAVPKPYKLGKAGAAFWRWAWKSPQATSWDSGALYTVARRSSLEDDLAALDLPDTTLEVIDLLGIDEESAKLVAFALRQLKAHGAGRTSVMKEMRELDKVLGLNPKALADLRWTIVADAAPPPADAGAPPSNVRRIRPRNPAAATG